MTAEMTDAAATEPVVETTADPAAGADPSAAAAPAPDAAEATTPETPSEPDMAALVAEHAKEKSGLRGALQASRERTKTAEAEVQRLGKERAQATRTPAADPDTSALDLDEETLTRADVLAMIKGEGADVAHSVRSSVRAEMERTQAQEQERADREALVSDLRDSSASLRKAILPNFSDKAAIGGDRLMWAIVQDAITEEAGTQRVDPTDYLAQMEESARVELLTNAGNTLRAHYAEVAAPQAAVNDEARETAPLGSDGVAAELQPESIKGVNDPNLLGLVQRVIGLGRSQ